MSLIKSLLILAFKFQSNLNNLQIGTMMKSKNWLITLSLFAMLFPLAPKVYADPPSWAPAHGWRKKHDPYYTGYAGRQWPDDYGISSGRCNREAVGTALGGIVGGAIGSTAGKGNGKTVAIILGTVLGAIIGNKIGRDLDNADKGCLGHTLELGEENKPVSWGNSDNGLNYTVTPLNGFSADGYKCRNYRLNVRGDGVNDSRNERACLVSEGNWQPYKK